MKTTNVAYVPADGSYEITCTFVPNQWGFLADLPFIYLIACKKLRYDSWGGDVKKVGKEEKCTFK